jgi:hypothetical protein
MTIKIDWSLCWNVFVYILHTTLSKVISLQVDKSSTSLAFYVWWKWLKLFSSALGKQPFLLYWCLNDVKMIYHPLLFPYKHKHYAKLNDKPIRTWCQVLSHPHQFILCDWGYQFVIHESRHNFESKESKISLS